MIPNCDHLRESVEPGQTEKTDMRNHHSFRRVRGNVSRLASLRPSLAMGLLTAFLGWLVPGTESFAQTITTVVGANDPGAALRGYG